MKYETISDAYFDFHVKCLKTEVDFMLEHDLNYQQILYLKFLFFKQFETMFKYLGYAPPKGKMKDRFDVKDVNDLFRKGITTTKWIKSTNPTPDQNDITEEFQPLLATAFGIRPEHLNKKKKELVERNKFIDTAGEELFNVYPKKNDSNMMLVACNEFTYKGREYKGKEDVKELYAELIDFNWKLHRQIVNKVKNDGGEICNVKITSFVKDKMWEYIKTTGTDEQWTEYI